MHYGVGVVPARPYRPRDKAKVEVGVQVVERWIIAALRHRKFFRLEELNRAIRELLERLNQRPFRKREGSRASVFAALERSALRPLPAEPFDMSQWSRRAGEHRLPHRLRRQLLQRALHAGARTRGSPRDTNHRGDLPQGQRVASHLRSRGREQVVTERRAPAEESPGASGVDALAHGELGRADRTAHGTVVRTDPGREAASGDGLSIVPGDHPAGRTVLGRQDGSRSGSSDTDRRLPLPEREIDPEELARPATTGRTAIASSPSAP